MAEKKKNRKYRSSNEALFALDDIHAKYKELPSVDVEKFAPVYYPIAIVDMYLEEMTFEDFGTVQQAVLNLCEMGITDGNVIAETLGLMPRYIKGILNVLYGLGLTELDGTVTQSGHESLRKGQQIVHTKVWQKFQVDALNGNLLKVDQTINEEDISERNDTNILIGHLNYMDGMPAKDIVSQLTKDNSSAFIHQPDGILNTNVISVDDVKCDGISYARCYMMKVWNCEEPLIFAKRYDSTKKTVQERFSWTPLFVPNEAIRKRYNFEGSIPVHSRLCRDYVNDLQRMMMDQERGIKLTGKIEETLRHVYPFEEKGVDLSKIGDSIVPDVMVDEFAFRKYKAWIINFLIGLHNDDEYLVTNEHLYGYVIALRSKNETILTAARLASELAARDHGRGRFELVKTVGDKFRGVEEDNLIADITEYMKKLAK